MFESYLYSAIRAFIRQKFHFSLNIIGLAIGLAAATLIALYVQYETNYDQHQPYANNTFRVTQFWPSMGLSAPVSSPVLADTFSKLNYVEHIFYMTDISQRLGNEIRIQGQQQTLDQVYAVTPNIMKFIDIKVIRGDLEKSISTPTELAISQKQAIRLFGGVDIIGRTINQGDITWTITAVFADLPIQTHFAFNALAAITPSQSGEPTRHSNDAYVYLRTSFNDRDKKNIKNLAQTMTEQYNTIAYDGKKMVEVSLQNILDIHLDASSRFEMKPNGSREIVNICIGLSILLVLISCVNFINMSTAKAAQRAKEVGVKKALGASKLQLMTQFLFESTLITLIAGILALLLVEISLPFFNILINSTLNLTFSLYPALFFVVSVLGIGILAGFYPAVFISSFDAKRVLSGDLQRGMTAIWVRKTLLIAQSAISIALIITTFILYQQMNFLNSFDTGYKKDQRIEVTGLPIDKVFTQQSPLLKSIERLPTVRHISVSDASLTRTTNTSARLLWPSAALSNMPLPFIGVGYNIVDTLGLTLRYGRDFSEQFGSDWLSENVESQKIASIIISESIANMATKNDLEQLIGQTWRVVTGRDRNQGFNAKVVGIVSDIIVGASKGTSSPVFFINGYSKMSKANLIIEHSVTDTAELNHQLRTLISSYTDNYSIEINAVSELYSQLYKSEKQATLVIFLFTVLAIFLTIIGIFGLSSYSAQKRGKEVAIRKVLGASRVQLINLLAHEYVMLIIVSAIIALPTTYMFTSDWLQKFNTRIEQPYFIYLTGALIILLVTYATVALQVFKTASTKPSAALRYE